MKRILGTNAPTLNQNGKSITDFISLKAIKIQIHTFVTVKYKYI
jgi:hypothetical protein